MSSPVSTLQKMLWVENMEDVELGGFCSTRRREDKFVQNLD